MSGIDLMQALHTLMPDAPPPSAPDTWKPDRVPNPAFLFAKGYVQALVNPVRQIGVAVRGAPGLYRAARGMLKGEFDLNTAIRAPKTRFNGKVSANRVVEGRTFPLETVKAIRALSPGSKVNDVLLAVIGGGLHAYLSAKNELPHTSMTAMAPISVRAENEKNTMGNQVSAMIVPLGTHIADPAERLRTIHAETLKSKAMTNAVGSRQMTEMSKLSPSLFMALGARLYTQLGLANVMKPVINTVVTNVPGPPVHIYSSGARLISMHGLICLLDGVALGHVVQSYVDQATVAFTACRKALPDPEFYAQCLQDSFDALAKAAGVAPVAAPAPAPRKRAPRKTAAKQKAA
jgi:WS/DGAT/MGAT family acyltransferase